MQRYLEAWSNSIHFSHHTGIPSHLTFFWVSLWLKDIQWDPRTNRHTAQSSIKDLLWWCPDVPFKAIFHAPPHTTSLLAKWTPTNSLSLHFCSCLSMSTACLPLPSKSCPFCKNQLRCGVARLQLRPWLCVILPLQGRSVDIPLITLILVIPFAAKDVVIFCSLKKTPIWKFTRPLEKKTFFPGSNNKKQALRIPSILLLKIVWFNFRE